MRRIDEWESAEQFYAFIASLGDVFADADAQGEPQITIAEAVDMADRF